MDPIILALILKFLPWLLAGAGAVALARSSLGKALVARLREGSVPSAEVAALSAELQEVRHELGEVQERLDFAERLLAQQQESPALARGGTGTAVRRWHGRMDERGAWRGHQVGWALAR